MGQRLLRPDYLGGMAVKTIALTLALLATPAAAQQTDPLLYTKAASTMRAISIVCDMQPRREHFVAVFERSVQEQNGDVEKTAFVIKAASDQIVEAVRVNQTEQRFCEHAYNLYRRIYEGR